MADNCSQKTLDGVFDCTAGVTSTMFHYVDDTGCLRTGREVVTVVCAPYSRVVQCFDDANTLLAVCPPKVHVDYVVSQTCKPPDVTLEGQDCDGLPVVVTGADNQLTEVVQAPGTVFTVKMCPSAQDRELFVLCDLDGTKVVVQNVTPIDAPLGTAPIFETWRLDGTAWTGIAADLKDCGSEKIDIASAVWFCADGADLSRTDFFDVNTGDLVGSIWQDVNGATVPTPANPKVGACATIRWEIEPGPWCYSDPAGVTLPPGAGIVEPNGGLPFGASHGATSVDDCYLHAVYAIYGGGNVGEFNADDATTPFDSSTHGGILMSNITAVQAVTNAAVAAMESAAGVPTGTFVATYYITTANQAVWVYNAALWDDMVNNSTFLHPYTGSSDVPATYQEKHDINRGSSLTAADLQGSGSTQGVSFNVEVTKGIDPDGAVIGRRVWDDRTEPPTEIVGFDPALLGRCPCVELSNSERGLQAAW